MRRTSSEDIRIDGLRALGCSEAIAKRLLKEFGSIIITSLVPMQRN